MPGERPGGTFRASVATSAIALRPATPADAEFCYQLQRLGLTEVARHGDRGTKVTMRSARHRK